MGLHKLLLGFLIILCLFLDIQSSTHTLDTHSCIKISTYHTILTGNIWFPRTHKIVPFFPAIVDQDIVRYREVKKKGNNNSINFT